MRLLIQPTSHSDVEEAIGGLAVDISPGQIFRKKVSPPILLTYRLILSTASHSRERTNKVRSGQSRQLCYLTGRGPQVPPAQRISTAMQPLPASKVSGAGGAGGSRGPHPITVQDKPPMNFGGEHSAHCLRYGQAPRGRRSGASGWPSAPAPKRARGVLPPEALAAPND